MRSGLSEMHNDMIRLAMLPLNDHLRLLYSKFV
jgi:hypothetical protein